MAIARAVREGVRRGCRGRKGLPIWAVSHEAGLRRAGELVNVAYRRKRRKAAVAAVSASWGRYRSAGHPLGTVVRVNCPSI